MCCVRLSEKESDLMAAIIDLLDLPTVQTALIVLASSFIAFLVRSTTNLIIKTIHAFRDDILTTVSQTTEKIDGRIENLSRGIQEVKDEIIAVGAKVEQINGRVGKNTASIDALETKRPRRKRGEPA